jgi:hypothetical protein
VYVDGIVTAVNPEHLLRFTVSDVLNPDLRPTSGRADDELTQSYSLTGDGEHTILSTAHGDFAHIANGDRLYPLVEQLWDRLLPKIKELAERVPSRLPDDTLRRAGARDARSSR